MDSVTYSQRIFGGQSSLVGQVIGSLSILGVISSQPALRYWAKCTACNTTATYAHTELQNGKCKQPQCSLEQQRQAFERQEIRLRRAARESWLKE